MKKWRKEIIKAIKGLWKLVNGKKTIIGASLYFAVDVARLAELHFGVFGVDFPEDVLVKTEEVAGWIVAGGLFHKVKKARSK